MCVGHADTHVRASTLHSESASRDSTQALTEKKAIPEQRVMAGRVSVADSVARVALVTMEEAEQLDIELDTLGHDLWALEQRATLGARVIMVEEALNTLQQFVAVTKQAVADARCVTQCTSTSLVGSSSRRCQRHAHLTCRHA